jgi:hypothetical protein
MEDGIRILESQPAADLSQWNVRVFNPPGASRQFTVSAVCASA